MKKDRFLIGILVGIGVLAALAIGLFSLRKSQAVYVADDNPKGVVQNYVLALYKMDYTRAYGYLAEGSYKPTLEGFRQTYIVQRFDLSNYGLQVGEVNISATMANVYVTLIYAGNGPFNDNNRNIQTAVLRQQDGAWKIENMPYPYWDFNWYQFVPTPIKAPGIP